MSRRGSPRIRYLAVIEENCSRSHFQRENENTSSSSVTSSVTNDISATSLSNTKRASSTSITTCEHCNRLGHSKEKCYRLHPELIPKIQLVDNLKENTSLINIEVKINDAIAKATIDYGASLSIISERIL